MSSVISPHLVRFSKQILSLVPYANNDRLEYLVQKLLPEESSGQHLAVKNEIKKLAQQATKSIDLRSLFTDCEIVTHNKITHYLDSGGKELFNQKLLEYQNLYTIAIYHEVFEDAQERAAEKNNSKIGYDDEKSNESKPSAFTIDKAEPKPLVNKNRINHEVKNLNSSCKVFLNPIMGMTSQGKKAVGITASIEKMNNRKIVIKTLNEIADIKANKVYLWLYDHDEEIGFDKELELGFEIIDSQSSSVNSSFEYLLKFSHPLTDKQMRVLFLHYLMQKKRAIIGPTELFIKPLFDSITSKGYEQLYLNKTHDIPLLCYKDNDAWHAKVAMKTSGNDELWNFFSDEQQNFYLPVLLGNKDIQQALNERKTVDKYAFILKSSYEKTYSYSLIWYEDFVNDKDVKSVFNRYFKKGLFRVIKISSSSINSIEDAYVPSALPCHVHPKMAVLNRTPPKAAIDMISECDHMLTVSDISSLYEIVYQPVLGDITEIDSLLPKRYQLSAVDELADTEIVTAENDEARSEDRFVLSFKVAVTRSNNVITNITGETQNISIQGLLVNLTEETKFKAGEEIEIELTIPFSQQERTLKKQKYIVLGYDGQGAVRLLMNAIESKHLACRAIRKYLYQHMDDIEACGKRGSRIYGLQKAMRNIYAHNHFSVPFYLKATKHQQYINAASFSGNSALKHLIYKNESSEDIILNLLSNKKFRESCLSIIAALSHQDLPARAFYILVLPKDKSESEEYSFWYRDLSVLKKSSQLQQYMKKVSNHGQPAILKIELKKSSKTQNMYYRDEISYLKSLDKDLAHDLEVQLESTIGIGEVTDLTDIAIEMISNAA
ncbi:PilZ domain-containing protein [Colwellia psychrerythraea]|uniref:Type IV pilus assembly PilZ n=1 Tax=Colwellia psychrerythraea TaxID=28229 RepID=A0A099L4N9_COLPS|nr:PilZ domain-containing protein [Colwellia psychrerythraea]KGJ96843.1 type IV pilus assembly PilZ [Colwellia psychrerythraea]